MQQYEMNWVRLPLEEAYNLRELGATPSRAARPPITASSGGTT